MPKTKVDQMGVDQLGVDELGVDQMGVDQLGVDKMGVDQMGRHPLETSASQTSYLIVHICGTRSQSVEENCACGLLHTTFPVVY